MVNGDSFGGNFAKHCPNQSKNMMWAYLSGQLDLHSVVVLSVRKMPTSFAEYIGSPERCSCLLLKWHSVLIL